MKRIFGMLLLCLSCTLCQAQTDQYSVRIAGQGQSGNYLVNVTVNTKKGVTKKAEDLVRLYAVHGVIFRGLMSTDGYGEHQPLVKDPNVEQTKADFFNRFWAEGAYNRYTTIVGASLSVIKNKQTKMTETSATVRVDKEALQHYLEESGVIQGFSNLW